MISIQYCRTGVDTVNREQAVATDKKAFLLRIDPEVWAEIERLAAQELRSANAQAEYLLRDALARRGRDAGARSASRPVSSAKDVKR
jgi:hypothetical protein